MRAVDFRLPKLAWIAPTGYRACHHGAPNPSIERTVSSGLRPLPTAAHVKR